MCHCNELLYKLLKFLAVAVLILIRKGLFLHSQCIYTVYWLHVKCHLHTSIC